MFRIVETELGFRVDTLQKKNVFVSSWIPFITYSGSDRVYFHKTYEGAMDNLLLEIKKNVEFVCEI